MNSGDAYIFWFRVWMGVTQKKLAEFYGVSVSTISKWESGDREVPKWVLYPLVVMWVFWKNHNKTIDRSK